MLKIKTTSSFEIEAEMSILKLLVITLLYRCSNIFQQAIYSLHPNQLDLFQKPLNVKTNEMNISRIFKCDF